MSKEFRTSVGGQALMEGIMMRGPEKICCAVRKPDGSIDLTYDTVTTRWYNKVPLVRGVCNMAENLYKGYKYLMHAADVAMEGETEPAESKLDKWFEEHATPAVQNVLMTCAAFVGVVLALFLFTFLPTFLTGLVMKAVPLGREELQSAHFRMLKEGMLATVCDTTDRGVGIAAPQVGVSRRLIAVQRFDKPGEPFCFYVNPEIVWYSQTRLPGSEGCLSIPGVSGSVLRSERIVARSLDEESLRMAADTVEGFTAVIFQHEVDHLDGVLFIDRISYLKRSLYDKKLKKSRKA